jgi:hypothetical protein
VHAPPLDQLDMIGDHPPVDGHHHRNPDDSHRACHADDRVFRRPRLHRQIGPQQLPVEMQHGGAVDRAPSVLAFDDQGAEVADHPGHR